ncbi:MAG: hypothetical protein ABI960_11450 [Candidatus Eisenbacteria bacterium]
MDVAHRLPPIVALEGDPDPSLRCVIDELAEHLGASVCTIDGLAALSSDPDLDSVVAIVLTRARSPLELQHTLKEARGLLGARPLAVLAPQPVSRAIGGVRPVDSSCIAPPITVDRLLFALGLSPDARA